MHIDLKKTGWFWSYMALWVALLVGMAAMLFQIGDAQTTEMWALIKASWGSKLFVVSLFLILMMYREDKKNASLT